MNTPTSTTRLARKAASIGLALGLTLAAAASQAAVARFDTTSFSYTVSAGTLNWSAPDSYQVLGTDAAAAGGLLAIDAARDERGNWTDYAVTALTPHSSATASATGGQTLQGTAAATRTGLTPVDLSPHTSSAYGNQAGVFSLTEDGIVTFTVGWQIQVEGASSDPFSDYANALMSFTAGAYDGSFGQTLTEELFSFDFHTGVATASGVWTVAVNLAAGEFGYYDLTGTASAEASAVPEPGSLALMAAGLGTLLTVRRRKSARPVADRAALA